MSKPLKLLVMVVFNLLVLCVLAWQLLRMSGPIPDPAVASGPTAGHATVPAKPAAAPQPRWHEMVGHDAPGAVRWAGVWYSKPQQPAGALYAIAYPDPQQPERWKATFAGFWGEFLKYQLQTPGLRQGDAVTFEGPADLGSANERYTWTGRMTADVFEGQYVHTSSKQTGGFRLTPAAAPATQPAATQPAGQEQ
jgi:hypothetical protein